MQAIARQIAAARKLLRPLDLSRKPVYREEVREYFKYYGLDFPRVAHYFGLLRSGKARLATHVFVPKRYRATVVLVHGYLEHGGYFRHAVRRLLEERYAVVLFDLPGHGLSSGSPATIRDFSQYARALALVVRFSAAELKKSVHLIGHSMGGSAVIELLLAGDAGDVDKVVLAAPLVHSSMWAATKLAYPLLAPLVEKVPRMFPALSHDRKFMEFTLSLDPLMRGKIPLHWVHSMFRWNRRLERYPASPRRIYLIQGTRDSIVDGKYNVGYLKKKFPGARVCSIPGANHQLFNETAVFRTRTLNAIARYLKKR